MRVPTKYDYLHSIPNLDCWKTIQPVILNSFIFSCPHITPKPDKQGKVYWLSGPPGSGKTTTCQLMAKKNDFIFYEADAMLILVNPFVDINVDNVGKAFIHQKPLKVSDGSSTWFCARSWI